MDFKCKSPCKDCPYRKDAPKQLWAIEEYETLLSNDMGHSTNNNNNAGSIKFGKSYFCHKKTGGVCVGFLMNQYKQGTPCLALRIELSVNNVSAKYLESLKCKFPLYETVQEMAYANYPELKPKI